VVTPFKKPDGSPCYVLRVDYSEPYSSGGSCSWERVIYSFMDATGATIATESRGTFDSGNGFTCTNGGAISCTFNLDDTSMPQCPGIVPYCSAGSSGSCPFPRDAASE
jgi:hypothetical protein